MLKPATHPQVSTQNISHRVTDQLFLVCVIIRQRATWPTLADEREQLQTRLFEVIPEDSLFILISWFVDLCSHAADTLRSWVHSLRAVKGNAPNSHFDFLQSFKFACHWIETQRVTLEVVRVTVPRTTSNQWQTYRPLLYARTLVKFRKTLWLKLKQLRNLMT